MYKTITRVLGWLNVAGTRTPRDGLNNGAPTIKRSPPIIVENNVETISRVCLDHLIAPDRCVLTLTCGDDFHVNCALDRGVFILKARVCKYRCNIFQVDLDQQMDYRYFHISHASSLNMIFYDGRDLKLIHFKS